MRLGKRYSPERLEAACGRALHINAYSYKTLESILKEGFDQQLLLFKQTDSKPVILANELHAHPGIYLVIGVKMGLFALELLEAPRKKLTVESECLEGTDYPLPCINDGITAATLCSMNHKMMNLAPGKPDYAATFTCKGRSLRVSPRHRY
jgi:formylmethanofuran dehydrogenase subunit E